MIRFDESELDEIVTKHLVERVNIDLDAIEHLRFEDIGGEIVCTVDVRTNDAVPQGPYRTPGKV